MRQSNLYTIILLFLLGIGSQTTLAQSCADTDVTDPIISCPTDIISLTCSDTLPAAATTVDEYNLLEPGIALANDDCGIESITSSDDVDPSTFSFCAQDAPFIVTRTYTVIDSVGLQASCSYTFTFEADSTLPIAAVTDSALTYFVDSNCEAVVSATEIEEGSIDNCGASSDISNSALIRLAGTVDAFDSTLVLDSNSLDFSVSSPFPVTVEMQVMDACGNIAVETKVILVQDTIAPVLSCPSDIIVFLQPLQCDSTLIYVEPTVVDNCPDAVINRLDNNGLSLGDAFPIGVHEFIYQAVDLSGNTDTCSFVFEVIESPSTSLGCISVINLSIDENCSGNLTPRMVLEGNEYGCLDNFDITVYNENDEEVPNMFTGDDIGKSFTYSVSNGPLVCEGVANIEDKFPPQIECISDTMSCGELIVFPDPIVLDNCSGATLTLLNETFAQVSCNDPLLQQVITREWQAVDAAGNVSNTCIQTLSVSKFDIGTVEAPVNQVINLECGYPFATDSEGAPDAAIYGSPRLNGVNLWPSQFLVCNLMVMYEDETLQTSINTTTIIRTWSATTWYCGVDSTLQFLQVFNIADTEGPVMACPGDLSFSTSGLSCEAVVELPAITLSDICGEVVDIDVQYEGGFLENSNGGSATLPNGVSTVVYRATDNSGNINSCSFEVTVTDNEQPTPICEQFTEVSLTSDGIAVVAAGMFDDGSYDACGPVTIEVRRMTANCDPTDIVFGETVTFCCADLDEEQMVVLRVTDTAGNYNECMIIAGVQDKVPPILVQGLPDITLSCEFPFNVDDTEQFGSIVMDIDDRDTILLTAEYVEFSSAAIDGVVLGNCMELISDEFTSSDIGSCATGSATRMLTFTNQQGLSVTDIQNITFINPSPFTLADITFPADTSFTNLCDFEATHPDNLPEGYNYPVFTEDGCDQVGLDYDDQVIDGSDGALSCYEIIRTWTLADWCQNSGGTFATFQGIQLITVTNTIGPEITGDCSSREQCSFDLECGPMFIELVNEGTDDCTDNEFLDWNYAIDAFSDGTIDITGTTSDASGTYPVGLHTIFWTLSDGCGNTDVCNYTFEIKNCQLPTLICLDNLTTEIIPTDTDGDSNPDTEQVTITASFFDGGSYHICGTPIQLSFSDDVLDTVRVYGCDDIGEQAIQLWGTDVNGNQDFCTTILDVQNNINEGLCPITVNFNITGEIKTQADEMISQAIIALEGSDMTEETAEAGNYAFNDVDLGSTYLLNPSKNVDHMNGVTTLDIILIQKHILGLQMLDSPHKILAADINHSDNVSGSDIIQLRKMILGVYDNFPNNTSWRFIDDDHIFADPANPWISDLPETYAIDELSENMVIDFRGVKIGDVNGSAIPNELIGDVIDSRSDDIVQLTIDSEKLLSGESTWIPVYANNFDNLLGAQVNLNFDPLTSRVLEMRGGALTISSDYYEIDNASGNLAIVWHEGQPKTIDSKKALFEILVSSKVDQESGDLFTIGDDRMMSEAYDVALQTRKLDILSRRIGNTQVYVDFELSQNEPNPWRTETAIEISSTLNGLALFVVSNMNGQKVFEQNIAVKAGVNKILLTKEDLPSSGVFYYEVKMGDNKIMKKMVVIN